MASPDTPETDALSLSDADLVTACLGGDRNAFGRIVERYQRLLCSLAYSATGRLSESEDVAQETFVEAWRGLRELREPEKLRPWLCGILRYKASRLRRREGREPVRQAEELETAEAVSSVDAAAAELAMHEEEQAILWTELERVPALYREPLVLYYREHRSVEHVAAALDLAEDTVKQRLARGRKLLQERVLAFVEGALARSTPGRVFTLGVLAALPEMAAPARAAGLGAAAANGAMAAKSAGLAGLLATLSSLAHVALTLRATLDQARTPLERRVTVKTTLVFVVGAFGFIGALWLLRASAYRWWESRLMLAGIGQALVLAFVVLWPVAMLRVMRGMRDLRSAERLRRPDLFRDPRDHPGSLAGEYRSRRRFLGVPLVHLRFAIPDAGARPVFGWIAGGDRACGLLFAWGASAVAPVSIGSLAIGVVAIGNLGLGLVSLGTVGLGFLAIGAASAGVHAYAWLSAVGWDTAQCSGFAIAGTAAEGPVALAHHANDAVARAMLANPQAELHHAIFLIVVIAASLVPVACYGYAIRRRLGPAPGKSGRDHAA